MFESLSTFLGPSGGIILAVVAIVVLLALAYIVVRLARQPNFGSGRRSKQARLAVTDAISFGNRNHKLVLVRRDDVEHLVLVGGPTDILIESNIRRNSAVRPRGQSSPEPGSTIAPEPSQTTQDKPTAQTRLRPVANQPPPKPDRPQFVPRQEPGESSSIVAAAEARPAVSLATPHVRPVAASDTPSSPPPKPQPAPLPPVASPIAPAVAGGLVAAPLAATPATGTDKSEQESPFRDTSPEGAKASDDDINSPSTTTVAPRDNGWETDVEAETENRLSDSGSIAEDMDAVLDELSAKR